MQYEGRPDFIEALVAAAQMHAARARVDLAAIALSRAEKIQREQGYRLDPPLQGIVDDVRAALRGAVSDRPSERTGSMARRSRLPICVRGSRRTLTSLHY